jgi:Putative addiction module component
MADHLKELLDKASLLDPEARFDLVERLIEVDAPSTSDWNAAWSQEANDRLADFRAGSDVAIDADDVLLEGRRRIALRRNT